MKLLEIQTETDLDHYMEKHNLKNYYDYGTSRGLFDDGFKVFKENKSWSLARVERGNVKVEVKDMNESTAYHLMALQVLIYRKWDRYMSWETAGTPKKTTQYLEAYAIPPAAYGFNADAKNGYSLHQVGEAEWALYHDQDAKHEKLAKVLNEYIAHRLLIGRVMVANGKWE